MLFLPDRHLGLEGIDQVRARGQRRLPMNGTDGHHHGNVADLEASDAVLDRNRFDIVQLGGLGGTSFQHLVSTGMLGVIE